MCQVTIATGLKHQSLTYITSINSADFFRRKVIWTHKQIWVQTLCTALSYELVHWSVIRSTKDAITTLIKVISVERGTANNCWNQFSFYMVKFLISTNFQKKMFYDGFTFRYILLKFSFKFSLYSNRNLLLPCFLFNTLLHFFFWRFYKFILFLVDCFSIIHSGFGWNQLSSKG